MQEKFQAVDSDQLLVLKEGVGIVPEAGWSRPK
jgi:hypothetical protein